jgi:hypothetical protein
MKQYDKYIIGIVTAAAIAATLTIFPYRAAGLDYLANIKENVTSKVFDGLEDLANMFYLAK